MCRTLIYNVLESCPELTPLIFPTHWAKACSMPWQVQKEIPISNRDVLRAFDLIIESSRISDGFRFCFFIDGLDELENTAEFSHGDLVDLFHDWHQRSSGHIKMCVSSREYNVFMNGFSPTRRICLHTLTRRDLERFARDRLKCIKKIEVMDQVINKILEKAQGIFFWVTLVVNNMRKHIEDGFDSNNMVEQIEVLPTEINDLFTYILDSLGTWAKRKAFLTLAIMLEANLWDLKVPILGYIFLDDYERNMHPDFGLTHAIKYDTRRHITARQWTETRLNGICKGLVECCTPSFFGQHSEPFLQFGHRSVEEFLSDPKRKYEMILSLDGFSAPEALSHIVLLSKRNAGEFDDPSFWCSQGFYGLPNILLMRQKHNLDQEPWVFLESLEAWLGEGQSYMLLENPGMLYLPPTLLIPCLHFDNEFEPKNDPLFASVASPLFVLILLGHEKYPLWKLTKEKATNLSRRKVSLIISCAFEFYSHKRNRFSRLKLDHNDIGPALVRVLLKRGLVSWDIKIDCTSSMFAYWHAPSLTLLQLSFITANIWAGSYSADWIGVIIEELLQHNPDLHFSLLMDTSKRPLYFEFKCEGNVTVTFGKIRTGQILIKLDPRQIVKKCKFRNRQRILQMLKEQMSSVKLGVPDAKSLVDQKLGSDHNQERSPAANEVAKPSKTTHYPNPEYVDEVQSTETMRSNDVVEKVTLLISTQAKYIVVFVIGITIGE